LTALYSLETSFNCCCRLLHPLVLRLKLWPISKLLLLPKLPERLGPSKSYFIVSALLISQISIMNVSSALDHWIFGLGILFVLFSVALFTINKRERDALLNRFDLHRRRASGASTPPRSFSPSKKSLLSITPNPDYYSTFPPSRRAVLPEISEKASPSNSTVFIGAEPSLDFLLRDPLPTTRSYSIENDVPKYTPTGFSTAEIKAMGDFPAYDVLSGVPLPEPYKEFDPSKALPRPYRPFRWAYHQTMCRLHSFSV
jgi:hypothetical protein